MLLRTVGHSVLSGIRKRGVVVAAAVACAQLWSAKHAGATAPPAPTSVSVDVSYVQDEFSDFWAVFQVGWDRTAYSSGPQMKYYINFGYTSIDGSTVLAFDSSASLKHDSADGGGSGAFPVYDGFHVRQIPYLTNQDYEIGVTAYNGDGENTTWCGAVYGT